MVGCSRCKSENIVKHGKRKNKLAEKQVFKCKKCLVYFSKGQQSFRQNEKIVHEVMRLFCQGWSYGGIVSNVYQNYGTKLAKSSVHRWVKNVKEGKWQKFS
jgi:transposase-like protein